MTMDIYMETGRRDISMVPKSTSHSAKPFSPFPPAFWNSFFCWPNLAIPVWPGLRITSTHYFHVLLPLFSAPTFSTSSPVFLELYTKTNFYLSKFEIFLCHLLTKDRTTKRSGIQQILITKFSWIISESWINQSYIFQNEK